MSESAEAIFGAMRYGAGGTNGETVIRIRVPAARSIEWVRQRLGLDRQDPAAASEQPTPPPAGGTGTPRR